jgi:hypothetical protein
VRAAACSNRVAVFKSLRQAARGSTERTRSVRNSIARLVLIAFGVVNVVNLSMQSKGVVNDLNDRVEVTSSSENQKRGKGYLSAAKLSLPQQV